MKRLIKNGTLVTAERTFEGDLLIDGEKIAAIGKSLEDPEAEIIDAKGLFVMPGGIDVHTHMALDVGIATATDDFFTGTVAAACGGTTTIIDHIGFGPKGCNLHHQIAAYHDLARDMAVIDYSFHGVVQHIDEAILEEFKTVVDEESVTSFKLYLTYDFKLDDLSAYKALERIAQAGALTAVHPENDAIVSYNRSRFIEMGRTTPLDHARSRPPECEAEAIARMINLAKMAGDAPLYIVHLSNAMGLDYIKMAQQRGQTVYAETCPQYLLLDETAYEEPDHGGLKYVMSPPLREKWHQDALWQGLIDGSISVVATDHCPFDFETKLAMGKDDFTRCPNGAGGVETRVPLMFSEGVMKGRIGLNRFVEIISTLPAKLFGLYPKKGTLEVGSDADIILIDPGREVTLTQAMLHQNVDHTPFEGFEVTGYPVMTLSRGEVICRDNEFIGTKGRGRFLGRKPFEKLNIEISE